MLASFSFRMSEGEFCHLGEATTLPEMATTLSDLSEFPQSEFPQQERLALNSDKNSCWRMAVQHLANLGHQRIAYFGAEIE